MAALFLALDEVLAIHTHQVDRYGGALGTRDQGLLESALAMPEATFAGEHLHPSLPEQAAAYLFHLVKNHPFVDGNKRVGLACGLVFLRLIGSSVAPRSVIAWFIHCRYGTDNESFPRPTLMAISQTVAALRNSSFAGSVIAERAAAPSR